MNNDENRKYAENSILELAVLSVLGDREEQQDYFDSVMTDIDCFACVCDGMGGHKGGRLASTTAVNTLINEFCASYPLTDVPSFLRDVANEADKNVLDLKGDNGEPINAGTTMVSVYIKNDEMYWASVGDSRLYLVRAGEIAQVTLDHNYHEYLKEQLLNGQIDNEQFAKEDVRGEALINFLGIGGLQIIDHNDEPLKLFSGDRLIIMSDGLYKLVDDETILSLTDNFENISDALSGFEMKAQTMARKKNVRRDNMTVILIKIK